MKIIHRIEGKAWNIQQVKKNAVSVLLAVL